MKKIEGKEFISATIIKDSISKDGNRMMTYELEYPRFILAEVNTHKMLSKNTASSRAIPVAKMIEHVLTHTAKPVHWGKNQAGMVAEEIIDSLHIPEAVSAWTEARDVAIEAAKKLNELKLHKQIVNRVIEPYTIAKTVMSGTEWTNLDWLRRHADAQPEFFELADCINTARNESMPVEMKPGQWHLPYVDVKYEGATKTQTYWSNGIEVDLITARMISASCCAQVSYRKLDDTIEKAKSVYDMLNLDQNEVPKHASPVEHQASVMLKSTTDSLFGWEQGVTHVDRAGNLWSGNLKGWVQYRKLIANEARW